MLERYKRFVFFIMCFWLDEWISGKKEKICVLLCENIVYLNVLLIYYALII